MKSTRLVLCLFLLFLSYSLTKAQIYTESDVSSLLKKSEKDSIEQIERLAALEFHKLINQYRNKNNLSTLVWDETLWITTRNHSTWMLKTGKLSHQQTTKNEYFTGSNPGDRFNYAAGGSSRNSWSGENALYNYSAYGRNIEDIAKNIAKSSFNQWKKSPGHNRNMLGKNHASHGTAFKLNGSQVWGTDLFASGNVRNQPSSKPTYYTKQKRHKHRFSSSKTRLKISKDLFSLLTETLGFKVKRRPHKKAIAKKKARNLLAKKIKLNKNEGVLLSKQKTTVFRSLLGFVVKEKQTYNLVIEKGIDEFDVDLITKQLVRMVKENQTFYRKSKLDIGVAVRKRKDTIRVTLVSILQNPRARTHTF